MHDRHQAVGAAPVEQHRPVALGGAAAILGLMVFEAVGQGDADAMRGAGDRVADRLGRGLDDAVDREAPGARLDVGFEEDGQEQRLVDGLEER